MQKTKYLLLGLVVSYFLACHPKPTDSSNVYSDSSTDTQKTDVTMLPGSNSPQGRFPGACPLVNGPLFPTPPMPQEVSLPSSFGFLEGPVWIAQQATLLFSAWSFDQPTGGQGPATTILQLKNGNVSVFSEQGVLRSNGLAVNAKGELVAATHDQRAISKLPLISGESRKDIATTFQSKPFNSPNDLAIRSDGNIYFSDPKYQNDSRAAQDGITGVYRISPDATVTLVDGKRQEPNGVALSPDEKTLYVGSAEGKIFQYQIAADGSVGEARDFANPGKNVDGMAVDCLGNIYAAIHEAKEIAIYNPQGQEIGRINVGFNITNIAFGDADQKTIYVTTAGHLLKIPSQIPGSPY